eukprot:m.91285 g.91285  ORF g.91285 m.91285 type:complete len:83 (-) comp11929_c0_seq2:3424-3672(-)
MLPTLFSWLISTLQVASWLQKGQSNVSANLSAAFLAGGFRFDFFRPILPKAQGNDADSASSPRSCDKVESTPRCRLAGRPSG